MMYPIFSYFFVCDSVERTPQNQINVKNIFNQIYSNQFPFARELIFVIGYIPIAESADICITVKDDETLKTIKVYGEKFPVVCEPGQIATLASKIPSVIFPKPGKYRVYFSINGMEAPYVNNYLLLNVMGSDFMAGKVESEIVLNELFDKHFKK